MSRDIQYKEFVHKLAQKADTRIFLNSDEDHALDVLVEIFKNAKRTIRIFAGCLCKHVGNHEEYVEALSDFIERGGEVYILLNGFDRTMAKDSNLYKRLAYYMNSGKPVHVKSSEARPYRIGDEEKKAVHFTVGDESSYRIETDTEKRTAECSFNNPAVASSVISFFDSLYNRSDAKDIDIVALINE